MHISDIACFICGGIISINIKSALQFHASYFMIDVPIKGKNPHMKITVKTTGKKSRPKKKKTPLC